MYSLAIHGGAGYLTPKNITPEKATAYHEKMKEALEAGKGILANEGAALDAVETAIKILEDSPLFNAGKGSVFTYDGINEMDAAIMEGHTLRAGAVARVTTTKNPISAARLVMDKSSHVFLVGKGADAFASANGLPTAPPEYFYDEFRHQQYLRLKGTEKQALDHTKDDKYGTVGAVAVDVHGHLAAGTSTGGMTNKRYGRVGDSPIIGAGTFANNVVAISATGHGEFFIRSVLAHDIAALMEYKGLSITEAAKHVVQDKMGAIGGEGGIIGVDKNGNIAMELNTEGMFRGYITAEGKQETFIFK